MLRINSWAASFIFYSALGSWTLGAPASGDDPIVFLPADRLLHDVEFLQQTLEAVHPNLYLHVAKPDIDRLRLELESQLGVGMTQKDFYLATARFVKRFQDDHTLVEAPSGVTSIEPEIVHRYRWKFQILEGNIGYIDFAFMSGPADWEKFLANTFQIIREQRLSGLIIDLRTDTGGDSTLGDALLTYITDKPYKMSAQKKRRFSAQCVSELPNADPWGLDDADPTIAPPSDFRDLFRQNPPVALRRLLHDRAPPGERSILQRRAPHWLDPTASAREDEILTLNFSELHVPPKTMPLRFPGPTCVLIGPITFSSGVMLADAIENFHLATLIGEETKPCNQFGEPYYFKLPNSGLSVAVATAQYVRANGDATNPRGALPAIVSNTSAGERLTASDETLNLAKQWIKTASPETLAMPPSK